MHMKHLTYSFFRFYLFILGERGREGENKGEKHQCERQTSISCLSHLPWLGTGPWSTTQACALTRNRTSNLLLYRLTPNQLSCTGQSHTISSNGFRSNFGSVNVLYENFCFPFFLFLKKKKHRLFFQSSFIFRTKLNRRYKVPIYPLPHTCTASPTINILPYGSTFVKINAPTMTHWYHPKSTVYIRAHSWCCEFYGFGQVYNMYLLL